MRVPGAYRSNTPSLEISQKNICGGECDSCKFELNKNTLLFSIDVLGSYFRPCTLKYLTSTFDEVCKFLPKVFKFMYLPLV